MEDHFSPVVPPIPRLETVSEAYASEQSMDQPTTSKKSMKDFLKQSTDIQAEIQRLSELCMRISPDGLTGSSYDYTGKTEEADELDWSQLNGLLLQHKFSQVLLYEDESNVVIPDLSSLHSTLQTVLHSYISTKTDLEKHKTYLAKQKKHSGSKTEHKLLLQIASQLAVDSVKDIPKVIATMQTVVSALPNVSQFIQEVCELVEFDVQTSSLDEVFKTIAGWKTNALALEHKFEALVQSLGAEEPAALERAAAIAHFCNLFEAETDVKLVVENVYYFVHEMKVFLSFVRRRLGIPSDTNVKSVLDLVSKLVKQATSD